MCKPTTQAQFDNGSETVRSIFCVMFFLAVTVVPAQSQDRPNIILIYADDVGFGDVSCNGSATIQTPNIDRLAREGIRFIDAHSSAATCTPSRFALMTGQYAFRQKGTGVLAGNANLIVRPGTPTIASLLHSAGYATGVVGKWHLGLGDGAVNWNAPIKPGPNEIGFDYHFLIPATGDRVPCVYVEQDLVVGLDPNDPIDVSYGPRIGKSPSGQERPDLLKQKWSHGHNSTIVNGISRIGWMTGGDKARWVDEDMADAITSHAIQFIDTHRQRPFFLFFSTHDIHVPRVPHSRFVGRSQLGLRGDAMLQLDWCVGQLLRRLDDLGIAQNTLVMFTSDNGPVLDDGYHDQANEKLSNHDPNGPNRAGKYSQFEGGTRVPFLARWPDKIRAGQVSHALFGQIDLAASFAKLIGAAIEGGAFPDSLDESDTLLGQDTIGRPHLVHEAGALALRIGKWKYLPPGKTRDHLGPWTDIQTAAPGALYDLSTDVGEKHNLAGQFPEQLAAMTHLLDEIRRGPVR